ncbi:MAG TPA: hypothetical protein VH184_18095 [Dongiaceae bacterium]|nr:hypothetical protein [Dongiaceae bacterium]
MLTDIQLPLQILFLGLVLALALAFVPVMVKLVIGFQLRAGNSDLALVRSAAARQNAIIWALWILMLAGLAVALPAMIRDGFFSAGAAPAEAADLGPSQGTLVAAPGMAVADMLAQSSVKLEGGGKANVPFAGGGVFDFHVAGTDTVFRQCRYYFISTLTKDPSRIEPLSIGTAPQKLTRAALEAANAAMRRQLKAEGWLAGHEEYKTAENQQLHGGATRGPEGWVWLKNATILDIETKRMDDPVTGEDPVTAGEWIQFIELWPEATYPGREFLVFQPAQ